MRLRLLMLLALTLSLAAAPGAARAPDPAPDALAALEGAARVYHVRPVSETVLVRVTSAEGRRTEQLRFRSRPDQRRRDWREARVDVEIDLGDVLVWTTRNAVRAVHRLNAGVYFEAPAEADTRALERLEGLLPPLPMPQLDLIGAAAGGPTRLTDYAREIEWADTVEVVSPATIRLRGRSGENVVELEMHPKSFRLQYAMIDVERGRAVVEIVFREPDDGSRGGLLGASVEGRGRVESLGDLEAQPGDVVAGVELPRLLMTPWGEVGPEASVVLGPGALVVFRGWDDDVGAAMGGVRAALDDKVLARAWPLVVHDLAAGGFDEAMTEVAGRVSPLPLHFSLSERSTLRRFSAEGDGAVVIIDDRNMVRGVFDIEAGVTPAQWRERIGAALKGGESP